MFDLSKFVKPAPFFQFLGLMLVIGGLIVGRHLFGELVAYFGVGMSFAGFVFDKIYP